MNLPNQKLLENVRRQLQEMLVTEARRALPADPNYYCGWVPGIEPLVTKGGTTIQKGLIRGILSSENRDLVGEVVVQDGLDLAPLMGESSVTGKAGMITVEHPSGVFNPVGEPVEHGREVLKGNVPCTTLTTQLWVDDDELANKTWNKILRIHKGSKGRCGLGYSLEGKWKTRDVAKSMITSMYVHATAITSAPRNRDSWFEPVFKSALADLNGPLHELVMKAEAADPDLFGADLGPDLVAANGVDIEKLISSLGLTPGDLVIARVLKDNPTANWKKAIALLAGAAATLKNKGS